MYEEPDRRRAQVECAYNACGSWKLDVATSQNEYWRYVRQGMEQLLDWLESSGQKMPSFLREPLLGYKDDIGALCEDHALARGLCDERLYDYDGFGGQNYDNIAEAMTAFRAILVYIRFESDTNAPFAAYDTDLARTYHQPLWPDETQCIRSNCPGHNGDPTLPANRQIEDLEGYNRLLRDLESVVLHSRLSAG